MVRQLVGAALVLLTAACSTLPGVGPSSQTVYKQASERLSASSSNAAVPFVLVDLDTEDVGVVLNAGLASGSGKLGRSGPGQSSSALRAGDVVSISIFESKEGGLYPRDGIKVPDQEVGPNGTVKIPFSGDVAVVGLEPAAAQRAVEQSLSDRAIEPQAVISVVSRNGARFSVSGSVNDPGVFTIPQGGMRILEAIARAGGPKFEASETLVTLQSGGNVSEAHLADLVASASANGFVAAGDVLILQRQSLTFTVFGATGANGQFPIDQDRLALSDGLARAGGLADLAADTRFVLIYRFVPRSDLERLGAGLAAFPASQRMIPTVIRVDLSQGVGYFLAKSLVLKPNDLVYVSNAPLRELSKIADIVKSTSSAVLTTKQAIVYPYEP